MAATGKIVEGVFAINKPPSITSAQVLRDLQTHFNPSTLFSPWLTAEKARRSQENHNQKQRRRDKKPPQVKIGHGGTLDPLATGVLIAGIGKGTKHLQSFLECTKSYEAVILFGAATDTYDRGGKVLAQAPYAHITREMIEENLGKFRGKIMQKPPIFSALRVQGKRLYEYAREGKEVPVEIQERPVEVLELELVDWMDGGTHEYRWPKEGASGEEKAIAEKVLHLGPIKDEAVEQGLEQGSSSTQTGTIQDTESSPASKRKRDVSEQDDLVSDSPKKSKTGASTIMSGALPPVDPEPANAFPSATPSDPAFQQPSTPPPPAELPQPTPPACKLRVTVTSGFYVRSLCHDLGSAVGSLALMSELVRTRQGDYELGNNVLEYDDLSKGESVWGPKVEGMLDEWKERQGSVGGKGLIPEGVEL
ncbi:MAG: hypothetical protein M1812_004142 [Candelaria pacifica]|nr:MAG: hypothetical protein M1812_004142 [Candelaria pacifica]